ncbi:hypothetical protein B0H14DRAFT_3450272 [Mycena olivaceomarginata]|nr:hypothetical protein B0H14DRAFT_3450272 [Mycena olivaceomarginata]
MSPTRHTSPNHPVKAEEHPGSDSTLDQAGSDVKPHRKRARQGSMTAAEHASFSGRVKEEDISGSPNRCDANSELPSTSCTHTDAEYERLQELLEAAFRTREIVMEQNIALAAELRKTRRALHNLRAFTEFASNKLYEQATRRFRGIDSDTASEDDLESSKSDEEM